MSFPAGIVRVFSGSAAPPVLSFRLLNAGAIEQFLPNADLLYRCGDTVTLPAAWGRQAAAIGVQGPWEVAGAVMGGAGIGIQGVPGGHRHPASLRMQCWGAVFWGYMGYLSLWGWLGAGRYSAGSWILGYTGVPVSLGVPGHPRELAHTALGTGVHGVSGVPRDPEHPCEPVDAAMGSWVSGYWVFWGAPLLL